MAEFIPIPQVYAAGRLDADSEGLLLLTNNGRLQQRLTDPRFGHWRRYWVQVEGEAAAHPEALERLRSGLLIQGQLTLPARAQAISDPSLPERTPPIRQRAAIPTSWLQLELQEGRNRQVRRMTAAVNLPTLRLLRVAIDLMDGAAPLELNGLAPGQWREVDEAESQRLERLLKQSRAMGKMSPRLSPRPVSSGPVSSGRGGRAGGGKSGRGAGGG